MPATGASAMQLQLTIGWRAEHHLAHMDERQLDDLQLDIIAFARSVEAPDDSFLVHCPELEEGEVIRSVIDGLTLAFISFCYHRHPRGPNVHELMERLEAVKPDSAEARELEQQADDAAAMQIPFIVTLNKLLEDYYDLRCQLEALFVMKD